MKKVSNLIGPNLAGGWLVRKQGSSRASRNFDTKTEALSYGRALSKKERTDLYIFGRDLAVKKKMSYR